MDVKLAFGQRLKAWRGAKTMTQEELATASGLHRVAIANIERGSRGKSPPLETVVKLASALGVSVESLSASLPTVAKTSEPKAAKGKRKGKGA